MKVIAVVHQSGLKLPKAQRDASQTADLWRIKNWADHPLDPGWDDGRYCLCHPAFRNSRVREEGEVVIDCVNDGMATKHGYIVRSCFVIVRIESPCPFEPLGQDLRFDSYLFSDGSPLRLRLDRIGPRGVRLDPAIVDALRSSPTYNEYSVSLESSPRSIARRDWLTMTKEKAKALPGSLIMDGCYRR